MRRLKAMFDEAHLLVAAFSNPSCRLVYANRQTQRLFGSRESIGKRPDELFPGIDPAVVDRIRRRLQAEPVYVGTEMPVTADWQGTGDPETRFFTFFCHAGQQPLPIGKFVFVLGIEVTDAVTHRPSDSRHWTEAALNAVGTPVLVIDASTRVLTFANRAAVEFVGPSAVGMSMSRALGLDEGFRITDAADDPLRPELSPITRAAQGEQVGPMEIHWHTRDKMFTLICFAHRLDGTTEPLVVVTLFDVTALRELQNELMRARGTRDEFVHLAAHELRTPLTCLRLQLEATKRRHPNLEGVVAISRAVDRMAARIEQLVDVAELAENLVTLHFEQADLAGIVQEAAQLMTAQARWSKCELCIDCARKMVGTVDRRRVLQVVTSLLSNAVKFGAGKPITVSCTDHGSRVSIAVVDRGIGVPTGDRETIFERFQRRVSPEHYGGLGLDLWVAKALVEKMGGTITVTDTPLGGATFTVDIPKVQPAAS